MRRTRVGRVPRKIRAVDPGSWDRAAITAAMREWAALVGRAPRAHEWSSTGAASGAGRGALVRGAPALAEIA